MLKILAKILIFLVKGGRMQDFQLLLCVLYSCSSSSFLSLQYEVYHSWPRHNMEGECSPTLQCHSWGAQKTWRCRFEPYKGLHILSTCAQILLSICKLTLRLKKTKTQTLYWRTRITDLGSWILVLCLGSQHSLTMSHISSLNLWVEAAASSQQTDPNEVQVHLIHKFPSVPCRMNPQIPVFP